MKIVEVNARGLPCPHPVAAANKALDEMGEGTLVVLVDTEVARDNVKRMAESRGCTVSVEGMGDTFRLSVTTPAQGQHRHAVLPAESSARASVVYLLDADFIGSNRELGKVLVKGFLDAIAALPRRESTFILISNGVKLATAGSYVLDSLGALCSAGCELLICGTCLDFFKIRADLQVGRVSNALEIMERLTGAGNVVHL